MDYKEYKESLSTTNGKGDDEYVVDTTEPKDINNKTITNKEVSQLLDSLDKLIQIFNIDSMEVLIATISNILKTHTSEIPNSKLERLTYIVQNSYINNEEELLDINDGIDKYLLTGEERIYDSVTKEYQNNPNLPKENKDIQNVLFGMNKLLQYKNQKYGNSALQPINVFSKESPEGSILIRLDDKLSRIKNSDTLHKNDISDIIGYLTLLCVSKGWDDFSEFKD